ncbi:hypothetical protein HNP37_003532 [Flavobacterium nitrogenifigens]|uniref:Uncharacterized protein n=2 Tax=Flavobacterium TaxID=237 RepID=A0A7W7J0C8_9FLAO|nr:hypothetical protein [Flavobacterium nitrogenifigens]MBB6388738.1 hypothetical protein [Flavobacterium notoginsengisoli]
MKDFFAISILVSLNINLHISDSKNIRKINS